ncbi:hypothetical protein DY000_02037781 [Brassica cretica]|uniref:Uncharacterized protein n=1 Tax=Brassica cretica TaxID=69181 RepID=A0ABQ7BHP7_BRACR|nr:hypothetical protein DY000_02037781 [Brassica cretica]
MKCIASNKSIFTFSSKHEHQHSHLEPCKYGSTSSHIPKNWFIVEYIFSTVLNVASSQPQSPQFSSGSNGEEVCRWIKKVKSTVVPVNNTKKLKRSAMDHARGVVRLAILKDLSEKKK